MYCQCLYNVKAVSWGFFVIESVCTPLDRIEFEYLLYLGVFPLMELGANIFFCRKTSFFLFFYFVFGANMSDHGATILITIWGEDKNTLGAEQESTFLRFYLNQPNCSRWWLHDCAIICIRADHSGLFPKVDESFFLVHVNLISILWTCMYLTHENLIDRWLHWRTFCVYTVPWTRNHVSCVNTFAMDSQ